MGITVLYTSSGFPDISVSASIKLIKLLLYVSSKTRKKHYVKIKNMFDRQLQFYVFLRVHVVNQQSFYYRRPLKLKEN